jgi:hypothetical protein
MRQHTSASVSIRQHSEYAYLTSRAATAARDRPAVGSTPARMSTTSSCVSIRQHTSASSSLRQLTSAPAQVLTTDTALLITEDGRLKDYWQNRAATELQQTAIGLQQSCNRLKDYWQNRAATALQHTATGLPQGCNRLKDYWQNRAATDCHRAATGL